MIRSERIIAVTLGLVLGGAVAGAVCALAILAVVLASIGGSVGAFDPADLGIVGRVAAFGAAAGALSAPLLGWGLLRHVPLGRALVWTAAAVVAGGAVGERVNPLNPYARQVPAAIVGAFVGAIMAGIVLRVRVTLDERKAAITERAV